MPDGEEKDKRIKEEYDKKNHELYAYMKEAPKILFNTNIFKNVKLSMPDEEIKRDQEVIVDASKFLRETAIDKLVKDL
jgi:hypothetical protein